MHDARRVGVIGATSPVGRQVLANLFSRNIHVVALSRSHSDERQDKIQWINVSNAQSIDALTTLVGEVSDWIVVGHIWIIKDYEELFSRCGAQRLVCISSTSLFTKADSSSEYEDGLVQRLAQSENRVRQWSESNAVAWTILRPTLIYGRSTDRNLSEIVKLIRKWRFFPLFGGGNGLRQPVYVDDVAQACTLALDADKTQNKSYNISGGEVLSYREMVTRIFHAMGAPVRFVPVPLPLFGFALFFLKLIPRYKNWNADMVTRMNRDLVFDHVEASRDFAFDPQPFRLTDADVQ